ncbi:MAG: hypothetical protein N4A61_16690 [Pelagimonas sp.]|jgi:hypothetical protein|nr:hypothetical protein [Pelagimonas sp.]
MDESKLVRLVKIGNDLPMGGMGVKFADLRFAIQWFCEICKFAKKCLRDGPRAVCFSKMERGAA